MEALPRQSSTNRDKETEFYGITFKAIPKPIPIVQKPISQVQPMTQGQQAVPLVPKAKSIIDSPNKYTGPEINVDSGLEMDPNESQGDRLRSKIALGVKQLMTMSEAVKSPTYVPSEIVPIRVADPNKTVKNVTVLRPKSKLETGTKQETERVELLQKEDETDLYDTLPPQKPQSPSKVRTVPSLKTSTPISSVTDSAYQSDSHTDYSSLQRFKRGGSSKYASYAEGCVTNASVFAQK